MRIFRGIILAAVLLLSVATVNAQADDIPDVVNFALADLSERVGQSVTLNELDQWLWAGEAYPDTSLGCPQPDESYAQVVTNGFQFLLTYAGTTYDYRVSADGTIVIFCESAVVSEEPATDVVDDPAPVVGLSCPELLPPRLEINEQAQLSAGINVLNVRSEPGLTNPLIDQIVAGTVVTVIGGFECDANDIAWWQVQLDDEVTGWVAEGRNSLYYLEPLTLTTVTDLTCPDLLPTRLQVGEQARLSQNANVLNVRSEPGLANPLVDQIVRGTIVTVIGDFECDADDIAWWPVQLSDEVTGWAAEGRNSLYYLEPLVDAAQIDAAQVEADDATETESEVAEDTELVVAEATCTEVLPTRLDINDLVQVNPLFTTLNVRAGVGLSEPVVTQVTSGEAFTIIGGPECDSINLTWWQIQLEEDVTGWIAEGRNNNYHIEPVPAEDEVG